MIEDGILIEKEFEKYLINNKYPENRINTNTRIKTEKIFDFVIYAKDNTTPLIIFEIKENENIRPQVIEKFKTNIKELDSDIECYFVIKTENGFDFYDARKINDSDIKNYKTKLPSYESLNNNAERSKLDNAENKLDKDKKYLIIVTIASVAINIIALIIEAVSPWIFNGYRFAIIIMISIVLLIPFIREVKISNLVYLKMKDNIKDNIYIKIKDDKDNKY